MFVHKCFFLLLGFFSSFVEVIVIKVQIVLIISCLFLISVLVFVHISGYFVSLCLIFTLFWSFCKWFFPPCPLCVCLPSHFGYSEFLCVEFILCLRLFSLPATVLQVFRVCFEHCVTFSLLSFSFWSVFISLQMFLVSFWLLCLSFCLLWILFWSFWISVSTSLFVFRLCHLLGVYVEFCLCSVTFLRFLYPFFHFADVSGCFCYFSDISVC